MPTNRSGQRPGKSETRLGTTTSARERDIAAVLALHAEGALQAVIPRYQALLAADPTDSRLWLNFGAAFQGLGRHEDAITAYREAFDRDPKLVEAAFNLGCALVDLGRDADAAHYFASALASKPNFAAAQYNLANTLRRLGRTQEAAAAYRTAIRLRPKHSDSHNGLGVVLRELGDIAGAENAFRQALELDPRSSAAFANLANVHRFRPDDALLGLVRTVELRRADLPPPARIELAFALGKIYDDLDDPAQAITHFADGAALQHARHPYDEVVEIALIDAIKAALMPEILGRAAEGCPSTRPIFVVGMPRSGTTLVEQILAAHPEVVGAGELKELGRCLEDWIGPTGIDLTIGATARERGEAYVAALSRLADAASPRVVDKMPDNFRYVGLIHLILPNAIIIHCRRNPLDICLSCYRTRFAEGNAWSYDLAALGRRYRLYAETMRHWQAVLPGRIYDLHYEALIAHPGREIRALLAHCGLKWDAVCLDFHRNKGRVATASATQVRQPLHAESIGRAARYKPYLGALIEALGPESQRALAP